MPDTTAAIDARDAAEVERIVRRVAARYVLPYFGRLAPSEVTEKSPGEIVTVADHAAEAALSELLTALIPGSAVVGEEAVSGDPTLLERIAGPDPIWIIDPIDGTESFVAGNARFTVLVALAAGGALVGSWTYAPALDLMATAIAGAGAYVDGRRVGVTTPTPGLRFLDVATTQPRWWSEPYKAQLNRLCRTGVSLSYFDTSGLAYVELAAGRRSVMIFTWESVWDHAAGLLLHSEAGGTNMTLDGAPFDLCGGNVLPFVAAPTFDCAELVRVALTDPVSGAV